MKANELMIGDWVYNTYNRQPEQVCEIREHMVMLAYNDLYDYDEQAIIARLKAEGRQREISAAIREAKEQAPKIDKELAFIEGEDAEKYLYDMQLCQMYANTNRYVMSRIICDAMGWMHVNVANFTTIHNYIDVEHRILRKGAVRALNGERLIIPMNMRDGSLLCLGRGNIDWFYSAPHGAGRLMSRRQALDTLSMQEFEQQMSGIYSTTVCPETIDESPMAYKPMQEIIDSIKDTVRIVDIIKPIYNFKAAVKREERGAGTGTPEREQARQSGQSQDPGEAGLEGEQAQTDEGGLSNERMARGKERHRCLQEGAVD